MIVVVDDKTETISISGLQWADIFLLGSLLQNESVNTKCPTIRKKADGLLEIIESATASIL